MKSKPNKPPKLKKDGTPSRQGLGGGRKTVVLTDKQKSELELLAAVLKLDQIADYFNIAHRTFDEILARDDDVAALYKRGKAKAIATVGSTLLSKARTGDNSAMFFYLKTQGGYRETSNLNHSSEDGTMTPQVLEGDALDAALAARGINPTLLEE
jgi:DNA-binding CsgD family transcriptional regulator